MDIGSTPSTVQVMAANLATNPDALPSDDMAVAITGGVTGGIHVGIVAAAEATTVFANTMAHIFTGTAPDAESSDATTISSWNAEFSASDENNTSSDEASV
jgi:hypothetical protein